MHNKHNHITDRSKLPKMNLELWKIRFKFHYLPLLFLLALAAAALLSLDNGGILEHHKPRSQQDSTAHEHDEDQSSSDQPQGTAEDSVPECSLFSGRWVYDNASYPLYQEGQCSFMIDDYACHKYGRQDVKYQQWRWQPHGCDLPSFNGTALLESIRGKKLVFVGDSLNKNQWISMLCLIESCLHRSIPKTVSLNGNIFTFNATEYNATIEFYWSPMLVETNCDDPLLHRNHKDRVLRITSIEKHAKHWTDADILIFDAFMWFLEPSVTVLWGSFGSPDAIYKRVEMRLRLYEMVLNTWSEWLELNINRTKTRLFFMSLSPYHKFGESWELPENCYNESEPILKEGYRGIATDGEIIRAAESAIEKLERRGLRVEYLNITKLSDYRKDGHPSIYRKFFHSISEEQKENPISYADCVHWCLPGVPDVWNQILYSYIITSS